MIARTYLNNLDLQNLLLIKLNKKFLYKNIETLSLIVRRT